MHNGTAQFHVDIARIERLSRVMSSRVVRKILQEGLEAAALVRNVVHVEMSGYVVCHYLVNGSRSYDIAYQAGDLGNLVHELTHISVNESFGLDFINFRIRDLPTTLPARVLLESGRCTNEDARQNGMFGMTLGRVDQRLGTLQTLDAMVVKAMLPEKLKSDIQKKLLYAMLNPHKEYDTVINQCLIWMIEDWELPVTDDDIENKNRAVNLFYARFESVAHEAYLLRDNAKRMRGCGF